MGMPKKISRTQRNRLRDQKGSSTGLRAAAYGRLSLLVDETTSPMRQRQINEKLIDDRCYLYDPNIDYYEDVDVSAYDDTIERPAFNALMANLYKYDVIVFYRLDRLARRVTTFAKIVERCEEHNVALVSATEAQFDTSTPIGKALVWLIMIFAEIESDAIGERVLSAQNYMIRNGRPRGGRRTFGWRQVRTDTPGGYWLELDDAEAAILRSVIDDVFAGHSLQMICDWLNEREIKTSMGNKWQTPVLSRLLRNPTLKGTPKFGDEQIRSQLDNTGHLLEVAEPLISESKFIRLQDALTARGHTNMQVKHDNPTLLSGIATCAACSGAMKSGGQTVPYYVCSRTTLRDDRGERCTRSGSVKRADLDAFVLQAVVAEWNKANVTDRLEGVPDDPDREMREDAIRGLRSRLDRLEQDRLDGLYDAPEFYERFKTQYRELSRELAELLEPDVFTAQQSIADMLGGKKMTAEWLSHQDFNATRFIIKQTFAEIAVKKLPHRGNKSWPVDERVELRPA